MKLRRLAAIAALGIALSACQVTVSYTTTLAEDGSGVFSVAMELDADAVARIGDDQPALLTRLQDLGWAVARTEPAGGGVAFEVSRTFASPDELPEIFDELRGARTEGGIGDFEGIDLELNVTAQPGRVTSQYAIDGSIDFGVIDKLPAEAQAELNRAVAFQIVADLPGDERVSEGDAILDDQGRVVWQPLLGERMSFAASSTVRDPALFIGILLGGIALGLGSLAMLLRSRRRSRVKIRSDGMQIEESRGPSFDVEAAAARIRRDEEPSLDEFEFEAEPPDRDPFD